MNEISKCGFIIFIIGLILLFVAIPFNSNEILQAGAIIVIIGIIIAIYGERKQVSKKVEKKKKTLKQDILPVIIAILVILVILYFAVFINISFEKTYSGLSIKEVKDNYENYLNQSVTFEAWSYHTGGDGYGIRQYDLLGKSEDSMIVYIDNTQIDTSMLTPEQEYYFTGIIGYNSEEREVTYEDEVYRYWWNHTYMNVTKIETLYDDVERHNTSRFIGAWKLIERDGEPYIGNQTWIFYENNSLKLQDEWGRFVIDGDRFYHEYYQYFGYPEELPHIYYDFADYYFSDNYTKLTLDIEISNTDWRVVNVLQKI